MCLKKLIGRRHLWRTLNLTLVVKWFFHSLKMKVQLLAQKPLYVHLMQPFCFLISWMMKIPLYSECSLRRKAQYSLHWSSSMFEVVLTESSNYIIPGFVVTIKIQMHWFNQFKTTSLNMATLMSCNIPGHWFVAVRLVRFTRCFSITSIPVIKYQMIKKPVLMHIRQQCGWTGAAICNQVVSLGIDCRVHNSQSPD